MQRKFLIPILVIGVLASGCFPLTQTSTTNINSTSTEVQELTFSKVKDETYTAYSSTAPRLVLIETQAEWEQFWSTELEGNKLPPGPAPQIDFQTQLLVVVFAGQKSTGGYSITVTGMNTNTVSGSADVVVYANQATPPLDLPVIQVITSPAQVVSVERNNNFTLEDVYMVLRTPATGEEQIILAEHVQP